MLTPRPVAAGVAAEDGAGGELCFAENVRVGVELDFRMPAIAGGKGVVAPDESFWLACRASKMPPPAATTSSGASFQMRAPRLGCAG